MQDNNRMKVVNSFKLEVSSIQEIKCRFRSYSTTQNIDLDRKIKSNIFNNLNKITM